MAQQRERRIPNPLAQPLIIQTFVEEVRDMVDDYEKRLAQEGKSQRYAKKIRMIKTVLRDLDANAEARIGGQLKDVD